MTQSVSEWQSHVLSCSQTVSGQLKNYFWLTKSLSKRVKACQMYIVGSERRLHMNVCSWGSTLWWGHSIKPLSPTLSPGTQKAPENIVQKNQPRETCHSQYSAFWMAKVIKFQRMKVAPTAGHICNQLDNSIYGVNCYTFANAASYPLIPLFAHFRFGYDLLLFPPPFSVHGKTNPAINLSPFPQVVTP